MEQQNQEAIKEIYETKKEIKISFKKNQVAPKTELRFYKVGRLLGRGGFGKVNLGLHKLTRRLVAIKSINKRFLVDERSKRKIENETRLLKMMRHESVIKLYETFETDKHFLFIMEICVGGDLLSYTRKRKCLPEKVAKHMFYQIVIGLGYIHSRNVIHRDIKLENLLIDNMGHVKIADFGVGTYWPDKTKVCKDNCGTLAYLAPEVVSNHGYTDGKIDIWAAGVTLFALLYGSVPFRGANRKEVIENIR